jgi:hypothetical protein
VPPIPNLPQAPPRGRLRTELLLCGIVLYTVCFWVHCDDHWWHMLTGRLVLETGRVPAADPFSFTYQGAPWTNWEWLAGVLLHLAWSAAGPLGLVLLRALAFGGTVVVALRHWRRLGGRSLETLEAGRELAATLVGAALLLAVQVRVADRPHTYAFLFLAGTHALSTRLRERWSRPAAAALVALFVLWVNFHPSWMLGMGLCGAVFADGVLADLRREGMRAALARNRGRIALVALVAASALLTPNADHFFTALSDIFRRQVSREWEPLWTFLSLTQIPLMTFLAIALAWVASLAATLRRREPPAAEPLQQLVLAALLVLAFRHVMLTPVFAIVAVPYLRLDRLGWPAAVRSLTRRTETLAAVCLLVVTLALGQLVLSALGTFGIGVDPRSNPVARADFMAAHRLGGRVLCTSKEAHSYMAFRLWPAVTIYIDGRVPQVFPVSLLERYLQIGDPRVLSQEIDRYGIDHVVLAAGLFAPVNLQVAEALRARGDFALVDFDENGALWSKTRSRTRADSWPCPECRPFDLLDPYRLRRRPPGERLRDTPALRAELARLDEVALRSRLAADLARGARQEAGI